MEKSPITKQTITPGILAKLGASHGVDLFNYDTDQLENGIIKELETMQTYTAQALSPEKLDKAFVIAFNNIEQNPSYYSNNPPLVVKQDSFGANSSFKENKLTLSKVFLTEKAGFDFNSFKIMKPREQYEFLRNLPKTEQIGQGGSRMAVSLGNGKVIKFAFNKLGEEQNKEEVKIYKKSKSPLLPKIYDYSPLFHWIMSEMVKPLSDSPVNLEPAQRKFEKISGFYLSEFEDAVFDVVNNREPEEKFTKNNFFINFCNLIKDNNLEVGDATYAPNWGITSEGKLVLLDYGLNNDTAYDYQKKKGQPPASFKEAFKLKNIYKDNLLTEKKFIDLKSWKTLPPIKQVLFLKQNGSVMGEGSSRIVYLIDGRTVVKLAKNEKGLAQNKAELDAFKDPMTKGVITKIYDYSADFRWLVSELARPFKNSEEFAKTTGFPFETLESEFEAHLSGKSRKVFKSGNFVNTDAINNPLIGKLIDLVQHKDFMWGDLAELSSWGKTADGRLVLLDYGFNQEVANKHYNKNFKRPPAPDNAKTVVPDDSEERTIDDNEDLVQPTNKFIKQAK